MRLWRIPGMPARCSAFLTRILKLHFRLRRVPAPLTISILLRGLTLSGTKTHVKQRFLPLTPLLMVSDVLWSPVLPA